MSDKYWEYVYSNGTRVERTRQATAFGNQWAKDDSKAED